MSDQFKKLYDDMSNRKSKPEDFHPYSGGNGRIDRAVELIVGVLNFPQDGAVLDVGGAIGNLGAALTRIGFTGVKWTLDISNVCREPAELKGNRFICANVDVNGFVEPEDGQNGGGIVDDELDLVVALDFIEHIINPEKFARECLRTLKPGGQVLINTPNIQYWRHLQSLVVDGFFPHTSGDRDVYHGGHCAFFNRWDMETIFKDFIGHKVHTAGLIADPPPPIWMTLAAYKDKGIQLSYPDLIFSCRKPE